MTEVRPISLEEMRGLAIFPAEYSSDTVVAVESSGDGAKVNWRLRPEECEPISRRLDGESVEGLADLYGPADKLRFIGAFYEGALEGLITWKVEDWNHTAWLCDIRVRADRRHHGTGARLLEDLKWACVRAGLRGIMLETQTSNYPAVCFYLGQGFRLAGLNTELYGQMGTGTAECALFFFLPLG